MGIDLAYAMEHNLEGVEAQGLKFGVFCPLSSSLSSFTSCSFDLNRSRRKKSEPSVNLREGDNVLTAGGIYGRVTGIKDDKITVEISDKVRVKVNRGHIAGVVKQDVLKSN